MVDLGRESNLRSCGEHITPRPSHDRRGDGRSITAAISYWRLQRRLGHKHSGARRQGANIEEWMEGNTCETGFQKLREEIVDLWQQWKVKVMTVLRRRKSAGYCGVRTDVFRTRQCHVG